MDLGEVRQLEPQTPATGWLGGAPGRVPISLQGHQQQRRLPEAWVAADSRGAEAERQGR